MLLMSVMIRVWRWLMDPMIPSPRSLRLRQVLDAKRCQEIARVSPCRQSRHRRLAAPFLKTLSQESG